METVILQLPDIVRGCPFDMTKTLEYHPYSYIYEYDYIDLFGNVTKKTATFTAIKFVQWQTKFAHGKQILPKYDRNFAQC